MDSAMATARADEGFTRLQAAFRGRRCRSMHVERVRLGLPWSPFVPAKMDAVQRMLQLAALQPGETILDIGSGDGRVVIEAASAYPAICMAIGIEIDAALVALSRRKIQEQNLQQRATIIHEDWLSVAMGSVDVVFLFFLPHEDIAKLLLQKLRPGTRVITYVFQIQQWTPKQIVSTVPFMTDHGQSFIYLYDLPQPTDAK